MLLNLSQKSYLAMAFESKHHPLGNLVRVVVLVFEASYTPQHPALLHIALSEIRSVVKSIHNLLRCLFYGIPKPGGHDDFLMGPGPLVLPSLLPKIYASLQGMF